MCPFFLIEKHLPVLLYDDSYDVSLITMHSVTDEENFQV